MNKEKVIVPRGLRYLSDWEEFNFSKFPGKCILDKKLPGCGFTEYCLNGKENVILCSPRKILLENKKDQHRKDNNIYLVKNELDRVLEYDKNLERPDKTIKYDYIPDPIEENKVYQRLYNDISILTSSYNPSKILVTYDSFRIVKSILEHLGIFKDFYVVVDEFQTILHDSKFKSDTELQFLSHLTNSHSAIFTSATPMMEKYLDLLDEFRELPYFELDWVTEDPMRIIQPDLKVLTMMSVGTKCEEIVNKYKSGKFEKVNIIKDGKAEEIESREAIFYINSVNHIINVINKCGLTPDEVNILCSDTEYNTKRLKARLKIKGHKIGRVPERSETNKMFTFCTRTVYLGADFYSSNARSFVFSDANINTLVVDISEDLTQIMGRQRNIENPWHNSANFYYITSRKFSEEEYTENLNRKMKVTKDLLAAHEEARAEIQDSLAKKYKRAADFDSYKDDYVAVNGVQPVLNRLVYISEMRSYEIQKYDYIDRVAVFNRLVDTFGGSNIGTPDELLDIWSNYQSKNTIPEKLRLLCSITPDLMYKFINRYLSNSDGIKFIMLTLTQKKITALRYNITDIRTEISNQEKIKSLSDDIHSIFSVGDHFSNTYISEKIQELYNLKGISKKAKATDIKRWFEVKALMVNDDSKGERVHGFKLIGKL